MIDTGNGDVEFLVYFDIDDFERIIDVGDDDDDDVCLDDDNVFENSSGGVYVE